MGLLGRAGDVPAGGRHAAAALLATLREVLPPELRERLAELARQLLLFVRSVVDWLIARLEGETAPAPEVPVEDIAIA